MNVRKKICIFLAAALLLFTASGAFGEAAEPDYCRIGLKVTAMMSEITDSEAYLSIFGLPERFREVREKVNTHDYDSPVAVYSVTMSDPKAFLEEMFRNEEEGNKLIFACENTNFSKNDTDRSGSGIGLENTRRRLDLIYADHYTWEQSGDDNKFFIKITLLLDK